MPYRKKLIFVLTFICLLATGSYAQTVKLALQKGEKYEQTTVMAVKSIASIMGQEMESNVTNTTVQSIDVINKTAKETKLALTTTRLLVNGGAMGQEMNYDSEKKDNSGPLKEEMDKEIGKIKNVTINEDGRIQEEDKDSNDESVNSMSAATTAANTNITNPGFIGKNLKPGLSWPDSVTRVIGTTKTTIVGTYTVTGVNEQAHTAAISFKGIQSGTGTMEQMGTSMDLTFKYNTNDEYQLDTNTGIILESISKSSGTMEISAAGMSIPATVTTSIVNKTRKL